MKAIMISIQPQWVEKILNNKKILETRKTIPKCKLPCKVYIYCCNSKKNLCCYSCNSCNYKLMSKEEYDKDFAFSLNGKVVAEFTLNKIDGFKCCAVPYSKNDNLGYEKFIDDGVYQLKGNNGYVFERPDRYLHSMLKNSDIEALCLTPKRIYDYVKGLGGTGYLWHIDNLKIYDKPKELSEFGIKRAFQSWGYVQELEEV